MNIQDSNIPSFFKHSIVKGKYVHDESPQSLSENIITDYDTPTYVRIMKKFKTPDYKIEDDLERKLIDDKSQREFFIRCYLPKQKIIQEDTDNRIKDVIIMINGLSETGRYDFYDQLGSLFASQNIASILVPTPHHLNRRNLKKDVILDPIMMAKEMPLLFYYNFKRSIYEIENLCDRILGTIKDSEDLGFYDAYFARGSGVKIKISLFGFSLGGLRALGCFMKDCKSESPQKRYHSCIAFNSTADPFEAAVEKMRLINKIDWTSIRNSVNEALNDDLIKTSNQENKLILRLFKWLYNRNFDASLIEALKGISQKFLMVQSGSDRIVEEGNEWNISDPKHGLNRIVVAGVDHIVSTDRNWHHYLSSVSHQLMEFIRNANDSSYSVHTIADKIRSIISHTSAYQEVEKQPFKDDIEAMNFSLDFLKKLIAQIPDPGNQEKFLELYYQSKGFYPKFPELLSSGLKKASRELKVCKTAAETVLRCGPGSDFRAVCQMPADQRIKIIQLEAPGWLKVEMLSEHSTEAEKIVGYISSEAV